LVTALQDTKPFGGRTAQNWGAGPNQPLQQTGAAVLVSQASLVPERPRLLSLVVSRLVEGSATMELSSDHRRWAKNSQRRYGHTQAYYLDLITRQAGRCAFSGVALRFDAASGTSTADGTGCHPLYAALDHSAPASDAQGHQIVCFALNDLKGHLPYNLFLALVRTTEWQRLMTEWRQQADEDPDDREGFYALLRQGNP
jgi:hypothetical protein